MRAIEIQIHEQNWVWPYIYGLGHSHNFQLQYGKYSNGTQVYTEVACSFAAFGSSYVPNHDIKIIMVIFVLTTTTTI